MNREPAWVGVGVIFLGFLGIFVGLDHFRWFAAVARPLPAGYPLGPEHHPAVAPVLKILALSLVSLGFIALVTWDRGEPVLVSSTGWPL